MIDRRILLASTAGLLGFAALRWLRGAPAEAAKYWEGVMQKVVASPQFKAYLTDNAASEAPIAGVNFVKFLDDQDKLYRDLLKK